MKKLLLILTLSGVLSVWAQLNPFFDPVAISQTPAAGGGSAPFGGLVSTNNLVSYWRLDETSGTRVDVHRGENLTDDSSVGSAAGKITNAASFSAASTDSLSHANDATLTGGEADYCFSVWINSSDVSVNDTILSMWGNTNANNSYRLIISLGGDLLFQIERNGMDTRNIQSSTNIANSTWYFVVAGLDSVNDQIFINVNNGGYETVTSGGNVSVTATESFRVGATGGATPNYFNGLIDEVGFWREKLSTGNVGTLYNSGSGRTY